YTYLVPSLFLFLFYCSADHRDLHSFPTRRSSDLRCRDCRWAHRRAADRAGGRVRARSPPAAPGRRKAGKASNRFCPRGQPSAARSEEHTSEFQSRGHLVCRLLLEKKKKNNEISIN